MLRVVLLVSVVLVARGDVPAVVDQGDPASPCPPLRPKQVGPDVMVIPSACNSNVSVPSGTVCQIKCPEGKKPNHFPFKTCRRGGVWSTPHIPLECQDINECHMNNGGCSHECVNTEGSYHCACPDPLVLSDDNRNCRAMGLILTCGEHTMDVTIPKKALRDLQGDYLRLLDSSCKASENDTHYSFSTALDGCGTQRRSTKDFLVYSNRIREKPVEQSGLITRVGKDEFDIPLCCYYLNNGIITAVGYQPNSSDLFLKEQGYGRFKVRLDYIKNDASFGQEAVYAQKDFEVAYRQRLTFEVGIATLDQDLVIQTANCCTTPTADHMHAGKFRHELIHEGCPVDPTTRVEEPTAGQSQRFSFEAFKFVGDFPFVYLHCSVVVCKKDDPDSRCAQGCVPGLNVNPPVSSDEDASKFPARLRRAAPNHVLHTYMLSRGPFALRPREDEASVLDESEEDLDKEEESVEEVQKQENGAEWNPLHSVLLVVLAVSTVMSLFGLAYVRRMIRRPPQTYQLMTS